MLRISFAFKSIDKKSSKITEITEITENIFPNLLFPTYVLLSSCRKPFVEII